MKNTEFNSEALASFVATESSLAALRGMIDDFALEFDGVTAL